MRGETVICVAPRPWHALWKDTQSIMWRIAQENRVLYFDPGRNSEAPAVSEFIRNLPNYVRFSSEAVSENLTVIPTPSALPHLRRHLPAPVLKTTVPLAFKLNGKLIAMQIRRAMRRFEVEAPVLWLYGLFSPDLVGQFGEKVACYTNYDDFAGFPQNWRIKDVLRGFDRALSTKVDVIFATSNTQTEAHRAINPETYFVPNAVDYDLFHQALEGSLPLPADLAAIPRPIIGYVGRMAAQIDIELLRKVAEAYPRCSLVFVGPNLMEPSGDSQALSALPNTYFLGSKPPTDLPAYLQAVDVALIPYRLTAQHVLSGYPTKLHEYLAAGRAVVATAMPELEPFSHVVRIGRTHEEYIRCIQAALDDRAPESLEARLAVARENTWDHRVKELYRVLDEHLARRKN